MINDFKDKPCAICHKSYHAIAMDLHHIDPSTKDQHISKMLKSKGYEKIRQELNKCVALCAICHRLLHAGLVDLDVTNGGRTRTGAMPDAF